MTPVDSSTVFLYPQENINVPSPGENILVTVEPAIIDDSVPTEDEIAAAVKKAAEKQVGGAVADSRGVHQGVARGGLS